MKQLRAKLVTEFVGTFVFLFVISLSGDAGKLAPLAIGGALMTMVYLGGHISGAHYNPAVSFGLFLSRKIDGLTLASYWAAQLVAGSLAFLLGHAVSGQASGIMPGPSAALLSALVVEVVFTFALVLVILNVAASESTKGNSYFGLAIGFTIVVAAFVGGPISGGAFNPAVGFGATLTGCLFGGFGWSHLWLYVVGPLAGATLASGVDRLQNPAG